MLMSFGGNFGARARASSAPQPTQVAPVLSQMLTTTVSNNNITVNMPNVSNVGQNTTSVVTEFDTGCVIGGN